MIPIAAHIEVTIAEYIEACPENLFVQKAVLGKDIQFFVGYECTGQKQLVSCFVAQVMHDFRLCRAVFLDFVCLVCNDKVGIKGKQFFLQPPCRFIVDHCNLKNIPVQFGKLLLFLCTAAFQNSQLIRKSGKTCKFLFPDRENGQWCCDQDSFDLPILIQDSRYCNAGDRFAAAHFHEQCHTVTVHI